MKEEAKKNTTIRIKDNEGNIYILEYCRETVQMLEKQGFDSQKITSMPMTLLPLVFRCAFLKNHKNIKEKKVTEIFDSLKDRDKLWSALIEMISECYTSLLEDNEDVEGNASWEIV